MYGTGVPSNGARNVRVTRDGIGSFTKGNRGSTYLGREWTPGLLASVGNPAGVTKVAPKFFRAARPEARRGAVCPGCGIERPLSGKCGQCW